MAAVVTVRGLTRRFGKHRGLDDVTFQVEAGEVFGYLGPNGAGKSLTIRLLLGLYHASAGEARVFGLDPRRDAVEIHRRVGYLPGELSLFPRLTGRQHLEWAAGMRGLVDRSRQDELIERFGADLDRPVRVLSKGNRQKVGIVMAFMHRPELLVLDEPTSGLDPLLQDEFARLVRESVDEGSTVFLSSHELDEVQRLVDRLAIIKEGRIIVTDTVEGLRRSAPPTIELRFDAPVDLGRFAGLDGVRILSGDDDRRVVLSVSGRLGALLEVAASFDPVGLTARPADLDELFLTYYRGASEAQGRTTDAG